jgi:hypothetical protein
MQSDTNIPTDMEYNVYARDEIAERMVAKKGVDHIPVVYSLPQNTSVEPMQSLQPTQDVTQLHNRMTRNITSILGIPFSMINGQGSVGDQRNSVVNARVFATNMLSLCRHLQELLRVVYTAAYGGAPEDVCFTMRPNPRICLENVDDLIKLLGTGVVSCGEASNISNMLLGVELINGHGSSSKNGTAMYRTPEQALAEKVAKFSLVAAGVQKASLVRAEMEKPLIDEVKTKEPSKGVTNPHGNHTKTKDDNTQPNGNHTKTNDDESKLGVKAKSDEPKSNSETKKRKLHA